MRDPYRVVERWIAAVNATDVPSAMALSAGDIEVGGPRGTGRGQPVLREWIERGGLTLRTTRAFARSDRVVLLQDARWRDARGTPIAEAIVASRFVVADGRVTAVVRYDDLETALREAQLTTDDELSL